MDKTSRSYEIEYHVNDRVIMIQNEDGCFGSEFMFFSKQDLIDMLELFEEEE